MVQINLKKAALFMVVASALNAPMFAITRESISLSGTVPTLFFHFLFACLFTGLFALRVPDIQWAINKKGLFALRGFFWLLTAIGSFAATGLMPVVHVTLVYNTAPLFIPFISLIFLKERIHLLLMTSIGIGFFGAFLFLHPVGSISLLGAVLGFIAAIATAASMVLTRELVKFNHPLILSFFLLAIGSGLMATALPPSWHLISLQILMLGLASGFIFAIELYFFTKAFAYAPASWLGPFNYAGVFVSAFVSYVTMDHIPSSLGWAGILLVTLGGSLTFILPKLPHKA